MPFSFQIDSELGAVLFTATGTFSSTDLLTCVDSVVEDPAFQPQFKHLVDLRQVTEFQASPDDMRARVSRDRIDTRLDASQIAIVSDLDVVFGMSRMYEILMEGAPVTARTFRTMEEARAWLELPDQAPPA